MRKSADSRPLWIRVLISFFSIIYFVIIPVSPYLIDNFFIIGFYKFIIILFILWIWFIINFLFSCKMGKSLIIRILFNILYNNFFNIVYYIYWIDRNIKYNVIYLCINIIFSKNSYLFISWLKAYVEAPYYGSIILASIMLKLL